MIRVAGLITTSGRKLDRENQAEHVLEVSNQSLFLLFLLGEIQLDMVEFFFNSNKCVQEQKIRIASFKRRFNRSEIVRANCIP